MENPMDDLEIINKKYTSINYDGNLKLTRVIKLIKNDCRIGDESKKYLLNKYKQISKELQENNIDIENITFNYAIDIHRKIYNCGKLI